MKITIVSRNPKSKNFPITLDLAGEASSLYLNHVTDAIYQQLPKYSPDRQRITTEQNKVLVPDTTLDKYGLNDGATLQFKDLGKSFLTGPQIGWRTVFLIEYAGPMLIHPVFYYLSKTIYRSDFDHSPVQQWTFTMVMIHFLKRELETLLVHRFSHGTMPFFNVFKNSAHYWFLSGINLAFWVYGPWFGLGEQLAARSDVWIYGCIAVWTVTLIFNVVATGQMYLWAIKKHKNYKKEFKTYPRDRKAMFPCIA
ncbi:hypothetical protein BC941DRAFT_458233 [Chlamydoabsidia padenii]|nr:hypothetical protein BC941DRAFT_458233 [Chlamydoabsidia padenii]